MSPGDELAAIFARLGIHPQPGCQCIDLRNLMNQLGPKCLEKLDWLTEQLEKEASRRRLPFSKTAARALIRYAVQKSRLS